MEFIPTTTWFFREPSALMTGIKLLKENPTITELAVVGCSTGEQPYSIQALIQSALKRSNITIDSFDKNWMVLETAKKATYTLDHQVLRNIYSKMLIKNLLSPQSIDRYTPFTLPDRIRTVVDFKLHDISHEPLDKQYPLIYCSNMLYYSLSPHNSPQHPKLESILWNLSQSLTENGYLITDQASAQESYPARDWIKKYQDYLKINPYFREVPELCIPKHQFTYYPKKVLFLAELAGVFVKKL